MAVDLPHHSTSTFIVCLYFTDFLSISLFDRFLNPFLTHTLSVFWSRDHTYSYTTLLHSRHTKAILSVTESSSTAQPYLSRFDPNILGVKKNRPYNMDHLPINDPIPDQMYLNPLVDYIESYHRNTIQTDEKTRDVSWNSKEGPTWENQYHGDPTPYTTLDSQSNPVDPFNNPTRTHHSMHAVALWQMKV